MRTLALLALISVPFAAAVQDSEPFQPFEARELAVVNGVGFSPDGETMYLALLHRRATAFWDENADTESIPEVTIYAAEQRGDGWSAPSLLDFSGEFDDYEPALAPDGSIMVFNSKRPDAAGRTPERNDLYMVRRLESGWGEPEPLANVNTFAREESYAGWEASCDLHIAFRDGDGWSSPLPLDAINTDGPDFAAAVSPDGEWLYYRADYRYRVIPLGTLLAPALAAAAPTRVQEEPSRTTVLAGVNVVDLDGGPPMLGVHVLIKDSRIASIVPAGANSRFPSGAEVIDAESLWLVPGLMNMHVHLGLVLPGAEGAALVNETEAELALRMAAAARGALLAGVTTIRTTGERAHADLALKRAIDRGAIEGPRIFSAGEQVQVTGGHGSEVGVRANDGPYEFREATRLLIRAGASWIKISISGGIATPGGDIAGSFLSDDEIQAVTDIAHRLGARVTAHSGSPIATRQAVEAGVDGIEHGYFLTPEVFELMREHGTWLVPTIVVSQPATLPFFKRIGSPQWYLDRVEMVGVRHLQALRDAIASGVHIALGTDQLPQEPNDGTIATVREAEYYVEAGMTPLQALRAATIEPAIMLGVDDELGSVEPGKLADLILVEADPTQDIRALRSIVFVMKDGKIVRHDRRAN